MSHALLSPSGASRWLACTPSAKFEEQFPDKESSYAREGTLAHELASVKLLYFLKSISKKEYDKKIKEIKAHELYTPDMDEHVQEYIDFVLSEYSAATQLTSDATLIVEQRIDISDYVPEGFGTADAIIIADSIMFVIDFKYGQGVSVSAQDNKQMMLYALGALKLYEVAYGITEISMVIVQPRINNISAFDMPAEALTNWATIYLKPRAALAYEGKGDFVAGEHCRFCKGRTQCKALADENLKLAAYEFKPYNLLEDKDIEYILSKADAFKTWLADIEEYALIQALDFDKNWKGFKLVEGRSIRQYKDTDAVAKALTEAGIPEAIFFERKLLGITALEKAITKATFASLLADLVIKPKGKPTLVASADKRPAINKTQNAIEDFKQE